MPHIIDRTSMYAGDYGSSPGYYSGAFRGQAMARVDHRNVFIANRAYC